MNSLKYLASSTAVALVLCAVAFARDNKSATKSGSFDLAEPAHVGSTLLQPGHYKAEWTGPDDALRVSILEHQKTIATTHGTLKELPQKASADEVTVKTENDNSRQVKEIEFNNRSEALLLPGM